MFKYNCRKYEDEPMLYLTSLKIAVEFLNSLNIPDISLQIHVQLIFPKKHCFSRHSAPTENVVN